MQLEGAFGISIPDEKQVRVYNFAISSACSDCFIQTLLTVVKELDNTLFEGYTKPKAEVLTAIIRGGVLDPTLDWYETPQPTGKS